MDLSKIKSSPITHTLFVLKFIVSGLIANTLEGLLCLLLWPFNKELFRHIHFFLSQIISLDFVFLLEWWSCTDIYFYVDKKDYDKYYGKENGIIVLNHFYEIDWLTMWCISDRVGIMGNCKAFAKKSLMYIPIIGWSWWFSEYLFLSRDLVKDKQTIEVNLKKLFEYQNPIWLLLYAEGTRFTPEKHEASMKFARSKGFPELKHHLLPRTKGFSLGLPNIRHNLPAVYNFQVAYKGDLKPSMFNLLNSQKLEVHVYMERISIEQIPKEVKDCDNWMNNLFVKKDKLMDSFIKTGDWFKESGVEPLEKFKSKRKYSSLVNFIFWAVVVLVPLAKLLCNFMIFGKFIFLGVLLFIFCGLYMIFKWWISVSEIKASSSEDGKLKNKSK
ncbi:1-acyl-sn-glycerol-3-phosphate acyltransferase delta-like [Daktulosphaira vitifoliae]|uniref:1-acyl-sn-glycerol-3-phosphate acyltransferase delta-like n=1 Tax=Daktulosphaira vitifoliae TaxID=58002 RepID=UPI0021A9D887|nr:1-acyl-sn-glycerol-3-phosphate acyltransferase delta-like [Daktulosphaira vitifoliae]